MPAIAVRYDGSIPASRGRIHPARDVGFGAGSAHPPGHNSPSKPLKGTHELFSVLITVL